MDNKIDPHVFDAKEQIAKSKIDVIVQGLNVPSDIAEFTAKACITFIDFANKNEQKLLEVLHDAEESKGEAYDDDDGLERYRDLCKAFRNELKNQNISNKNAIVQTNSIKLNLNIGGDRTKLLELLKSYKAANAGRYKGGSGMISNSLQAKENASKVKAMLEAYEAGLEDVIPLLDLTKRTQSGHLLLATSIVKGVQCKAFTFEHVEQIIETMNGDKHIWQEAIISARALKANEGTNLSKRHNGQQANIDYLFNACFLITQCFGYKTLQKCTALLKCFKMVEAKGKIAAKKTVEKAITKLQTEFKNYFETMDIFGHPMVFTAKRIAQEVRIAAGAKDLMWILASPDKVKLMYDVYQAEGDMPKYFTTFQLVHQYLIGKKSPLDNSQGIKGDLLKIVAENSLEEPTAGPSGRFS